MDEGDDRAPPRLRGPGQRVDAASVEVQAGTVRVPVHPCAGSVDVASVLGGVGLCQQDGVFGEKRLERVDGCPA